MIEILLFLFITIFALWDVQVTFLSIVPVIKYSRLDKKYLRTDIIIIIIVIP